MQLCTYLELAGLPESVSRAHKLLSGLHHSPGLHPCCTERHNFFSSNKGPVGWQYLSSKRLRGSAAGVEQTHAELAQIKKCKYHIPVIQFVVWR